MFPNMSISQSLCPQGVGEGVFPCGHHPRCIAPHHTAPPRPGPLNMEPHPPREWPGPPLSGHGTSQCREVLDPPRIRLVVVHTEWRRMFWLTFFVPQREWYHQLQYDTSVCKGQVTLTESEGLSNKITFQ